jgi:Leucine-rich repeat (LRR) protein
MNFPLSLLEQLPDEILDIICSYEDVNPIAVGSCSKRLRTIKDTEDYRFIKIREKIERVLYRQVLDPISSLRNESTGYNFKYHSEQYDQVKYIIDLYLSPLLPEDKILKMSFSKECIRVKAIFTKVIGEILAIAGGDSFIRKLAANANKDRLDLSQIYMELQTWRVTEKLKNLFTIYSSFHSNYASYPNLSLYQKGLQILNIKKNFSENSNKSSYSFLKKSLELSNKEITFFPEESCLLRHLLRIDLAYNKLQTIPAAIGQFDRLETLSLRHNQLKTLSPNIGRLSKLKALDLSFNQLTELPQEMGQLTSLQILKINYNQMSGLLSNIEQLTSLSTLELSHNQITHFPQTFTKLQTLSSLRLDHNHLKKLPRHFHHLKQIKFLHLDYNRFEAFPRALVKLRNLEYLVLNHNKIDSVPSKFWKIETLKAVDLSHNLLRKLNRRPSSFPLCLEFLDIHTNQIETLSQGLSLSHFKLYTYGNPINRSRSSPLKYIKLNPSLVDFDKQFIDLKFIEVQIKRLEKIALDFFQSKRPIDYIKNQMLFEFYKFDTTQAFMKLARQTLLLPDDFQCLKAFSEQLEALNLYEVEPLEQGKIKNYFQGVLNTLSDSKGT